MLYAILYIGAEKTIRAFVAEKLAAWAAYFFVLVFA